MKKVLLHACCAVCCAYPIKYLRKEGYDPIVYFYNPNIFPQKEYQIRLDELIHYSKSNKFELIIETGTPQDFENISQGLENEPEKGIRCEKCYFLRLNKTAKKAKELEIKYFTTTLSVSPHKITSKIFKAGEDASRLNNIEFLKYDFKKHDGFKITQQIARDNNMYKQTYCGCKYSIRTEILPQN